MVEDRCRVSDVSTAAGPRKKPVYSLIFFILHDTEGCGKNGPVVIGEYG
jgi:hypothetical protein